MKLNSCGSAGYHAGPGLALAAGASSFVGHRTGPTAEVPKFFAQRTDSLGRRAPDYRSTDATVRPAGALELALEGAGHGGCADRCCSDPPSLWKINSEFLPPLEEGSLLYMPSTMPGISITE